ncbi:MAG: hypothetical protein HOY71_02375 [Nonomuraea sp.]|nr:hypothetical protein [Nonomuraea sp.]
MRRRELDQRYRTRKLTDPEFELLLEVDRDNTAWLAEEVGARGWPLRSQVGEEGALAAWLLAQHADAAPAVQRELHAAMARALAAGEASPAHFAYLEDRVRVNAGRPQLYGTQFHGQGDGFAPQPIEDPARLDERRASVGLEPFAEYEAFIRAIDKERGS